MFICHEHFKCLLINNRNTVNNFPTWKERQMECGKHIKTPQCKRKSNKRKKSIERRTNKKYILRCQKI